MRMVNELQGNPARQLSHEAIQFVGFYYSHFTHFQRFSYIRVGGYASFPIKLPKYLEDKWVVIEACRKLVDVNRICQKRRVTFSYPYWI